MFLVSFRLPDSVTSSITSSITDSVTVDREQRRKLFQETIFFLGKEVENFPQELH